MLDFEKLTDEIGRANFFSKMGGVPDKVENIIYIESVFRVFIEPVESEFLGAYENLEWLPTTPTQDDPFKSFPKPPKDLVDLRLRVSKAVMQSVKKVPKDKFLSGAHDFSLAARNAACFAFRQYVSECYYGEESAWLRIVELYFSGRWPVGYSKNKLIVI
ncbi:hypothetical protein [Pseudomonas putida]|uniref:hypothetical protein n=1 Tax=Pseudomonas putida TaxID=303 RepID=UPI001E63B111|nr:hypothetical protein [Pseudomonas putida]MCE0975759.1 hypothetical protein [Pseudomonas putida]